MQLMKTKNIFNKKVQKRIKIKINYTSLLASSQTRQVLEHLKISEGLKNLKILQRTSKGRSLQENKDTLNQQGWSCIGEAMSLKGNKQKYPIETCNVPWV